jgi:hypothetical protein
VRGIPRESEIARTAEDIENIEGGTIIVDRNCEGSKSEGGEDLKRSEGEVGYRLVAAKWEWRFSKGF